MVRDAESQKPALVISLDFELYWGVRDHVRLSDYEENLLGVRKAVPAMLELFEEYDIHATWATVGFLFCEGREQLTANVPKLLPKYRDARLNPYTWLQEVGANEEEDPYHLGASLVKKIASSPHQEIGTHTHSHFCCLEPEESVEAFREDLQCARKLAEKQGIALRSLVFPRNQYRERYLEVARETGIESFRGNQDSWLYESRNSGGESLMRRAVRLLDAYCNLTGCHTAVAQAEGPDLPCNVPASRFLRPYSSKLQWLEPLRLRRILAALDHAAKHGGTFHLWWHPHNFGVHLEENLAFLKRILEHYRGLRDRYGMESLNMGEAAARVAPAQQARVGA